MPQNLKSAVPETVQEGHSLGQATSSSKRLIVSNLESQVRVCPSCGAGVSGAPLEISHESQLFACHACGLHFWHPVHRPDALWYEAAYQQRDETEMPLEPGHRYFLKDPRAPKRGRLLDLGCGVGNFIAAARDAGFDVTGVELDPAAARFAQQHYGLASVFVMRLEEFLAARPKNCFDIVTFFEVLEHQENPQAFLDVAKQLLAPAGYIALSVPNRCRWQKGTDPLDYPPNHLTRWSPGALRAILERNGFEILSLCEQPLGILRAAQVLSMGFRTGLIPRVAGGPPPTLADLGQLDTEQVRATVARVAAQRRHRIAAALARSKNLAMVPLAALFLPFLRLRGCKGLYLYSLARLRASAASRVPTTGNVRQFGG